MSRRENSRTRRAYGPRGGIGANASEFSPAKLPNVVFWLDGRQAAYSDSAGTTLATSPAGRVRRVNEPSPLTGNWQTPSDNARVFREGTVALDHQGVAVMQSFSQPAGATMPADDATMVFAIVNRDGYPNGFQAVASGTDGVARWGVVLYNENILVYRNGASWNTGIACPPNKAAAFVVRWRNANRDIAYEINGVSGSTSEAGAIAAGRTTSGITTGATDGEQCHVTVGQIVGLGRSVSDAERTNLLAWALEHVPNEQAPLDAPQIAVAGDSIAEGYNTVNARRGSWPFKMLANLYQYGAVRLRNTAVSGYTLAQMTTAYPTDIVPLYSASRTENILFAAGATNSMAFGVLTVAQVIADYWTYCDTARAAGWRVIACTVLPRSDATIRGTFSADRATFNTAIRDDWAAHADALADVADIAGMGADGDELNATNYSDLVHPTDAGHTLLEPVYRAAARAWLDTVTPLTILGSANVSQWSRSDRGCTPGLWTDYSGNAKHWTSTGAARPAYGRTTGANGRPALTADGVDDFMSAALAVAAPGTTPCFIWMIVKQVAYPGATPAYIVMSSSATPGVGVIQFNVTPNIRQQASGGTANQNTALTIGTWGRVAASFTNTTADYLKAIATTVTGANAGNVGTSDRTLFKSGVVANFTNTAICEIFHSTVTPTADQLTQLDSYATALYGAGLT